MAQQETYGNEPWAAIVVQAWADEPAEGDVGRRLRLSKVAFNIIYSD